MLRSPPGASEGRSPCSVPSPGLPLPAAALPLASPQRAWGGIEDSGQASLRCGSRGANLCSLRSCRPAPGVESASPVCTPPAAQVAGPGLETQGEEQGERRGRAAARRKESRLRSSLASRRRKPAEPPP